MMGSLMGGDDNLNTHIVGEGEKIDQLAKGSLIWGLMWNVLALVVWTLWKERSQRWHGNGEQSKESLVVNIVLDLKISFRETKFKASHRTQLEAGQHGSRSTNVTSWREPTTINRELRIHHL